MRNSESISGDRDTVLSGSPDSPEIGAKNTTSAEFTDEQRVRKSIGDLRNRHGFSSTGRDIQQHAVVVVIDQACD